MIYRSFVKIPSYRFFLLALVSLFFIFTSCTHRIGYGLITWSSPEYGISAGDVVPVFIQSNIGNVYVVGIGPKGQKHIELPLWQVEVYKSNSLARKAALSLGEYRHTYAIVKLDGLPIRSDPENTAKMVYRLKESEKIKVLEKGEGSPVLSGKTALEGDWLKVMTDNGTSGWCFSYNLTVYDERDEEALANTSLDSGPDPILENLLARTWYPEAWRTMIEKNQVDLDQINPEWGFFPGFEAKTARIVSKDGIVLFQYINVYKHETGEYRFEGSSLTVQIRGRGAILVSYTDDRGMPQAIFFVPLDLSPEEIIETEQQRRSATIDLIKNAGPRFVSSNYGVLHFLDDSSFLWNGFQLLSPSVIPNGTGASGKVEVRYFLTSELAASYNGVLSFYFESNAQPVNFLYSLQEDGLRLEYLNNSSIKNSVAQSRNLNPLVLFFTAGS